MPVLAAAAELRDACDKLDPPGVAYVYNPLSYAWAPHKKYCEKYGTATPRRALLVGMNPGPHGMGQTGVPFGDVGYVRDWMGIEGEVRQPPRVHPKRPITGFETTRSEPSGSRLYGWAKERYGTAAAFFSEFYIVNHCPLLFYDDAGKNITPPQLRRSDTRALYDICDAHLAAVVRALSPTYVLGVGVFATERIREALATHGLDATVGTVLHPSPASPLANKGWAEQAERQMREIGVLS